ncbi:lycopene cyclase [Winogradskyella litoriviva]|uniref:Lycopene cyclase n=1 Tax=Winogradskyella litoriviva TaxID=1220182 RepID=A0ABX2E2G2_9FLAO|nr:lycopene cyclase family protein [Winogradskyella litoriviva]NRD22419.1 lycopene cyclase [Winogradskyella litoriviva]
MKTYDYIILGAGASGLMLAYRMANDTFFKDKSILIIDKSKDKGNDRTWCFWETKDGEWDEIVTKSWDKIFFGSTDFTKSIPITPYRYKMIRSENYYNKLWGVLKTKPNITFKEELIVSFKEVEGKVQVTTSKENYIGLKLFNSIPNPKTYQSQKKYPLIHQHFVGWFIAVEDELFDDSKATFMDFSVPQNGNTRFMYVLPLDKNNALFEYTLFSKNLLEISEYEHAIVDYLNNNNIKEYKVLEVEKGNIPMTSFKFSELNSKHILNIGTAGGWTKASTGYTFKNTTKKTKDVVAFLKQKDDFSKFYKASKFWFYDLIFLDVLANYNAEGSALFSSMFKKAKIKTIFKFLDEESSLIEDLKIILSVPSKRFIQAFFKRLF